MEEWDIPEDVVARAIEKLQRPGAVKEDVRAIRIGAIVESVFVLVLLVVVGGMEVLGIHILLSTNWGTELTSGRGLLWLWVIVCLILVPALLHAFVIRAIKAVKPPEPPSSVEDLCRTFYRTVFCSSHLLFTLYGKRRVANLFSVAHLIPGTIRSYLLAGGWKRLRTYAEEWDKLHALWGAPSINAFNLKKVAVEVSSPGATISDIEVCCTGSPFGEVRFRNRAICVDGAWFLVEMKPHIIDLHPLDSP